MADVTHWGVALSDPLYCGHPCTEGAKTSNKMEWVTCRACRNKAKGVAEALIKHLEGKLRN